MGWFSNCRGERETSTNPKSEIRRLKLNWLFMMVIAGLYAVSYTSISSSFHQFITNPTQQQINRSFPDTKQLEPGLGESEAFYSWVITVFNVGAVLGSLMGGLLLRWVPYWHLLIASLSLHTLGYILYAMATTGWLVMLSKLLSGVFIGAEMTLALAYFGESNSAYRAALKETGRGEGGANHVKHTLFALHSVGVNVGYVFGPGVAVIIAQFPINQFRSIAWYNVAVGLGVIVVQILIFRGESSCEKMTRCPSRKKTQGQKPRQIPQTLKLSRFASVFILIFLVVGRAALGFRFCVYETLFNPILSDSFGLNERDSSYFFFGLVAAQVCGTVLLLVLQQMRLSNRLIAVVGLVMTIVATLLMGDWQAVHRDPCTDASLFHHPELLHTYTTQLDGRGRNSNSTSGSDMPPQIQCEQLNMTMGLHQHLQSTAMDVYVYPNIVTDDVIYYGCELVDMCPLCSTDKDCLHLHINSQQHCLEMSPASEQRPHSLSTLYMCGEPNSLFTYCLSVHPLLPTLTQDYTPSSSSSSSSSEKDEVVYVANVHRQSIQILEGRVDSIASQACLHHSGHCHWNPSSSITHRHCPDCSPICRQRSNYLEFSQFTIAAAILLVSIPVARVPITSIISDIVSEDQQGAIMGLAQALNAVARSVGPLWLDAAYEGMQKRTFLPMALSLVCYSAILVGVLLVYPKLAPPPQSKGEVETDSDSDYIALRHTDSFSDSDFMP